MMMSLGMFVFEIPSLVYQELQRRTSWSHAQIERVGARAANQFTGPGTETIALSGTTAAELQDGRASLDSLREMGDQGEAWPLVDGAGTVFGNYVIEGLDERHSYFAPNGTPLKIDFGLDLLRVDDAADAQAVTQPL
ncbi:phage tail protein [Sphingomonas cavernae]|uniref:Phage tail protein n=1 Tax=Sphingomonas cavernae TaxID=2320861 RepID=A0A418WP29_9SPHN|nr:phage tail protein [Sphingomonas cavernae]RJF92997.1 phage tail protein [Sphingomonas cavernae]